MRHWHLLFQCQIDCEYVRHQYILRLVCLRTDGIIFIAASIRLINQENKIVQMRKEFMQGTQHTQQTATRTAQN